MALMSARRLMERITRGDYIVADGGVGSELIRYGIPPDGTLQANRSAPDRVRQIHECYTRAGADLLTCNTFGLHNGEVWLDEIRAGVQIALQSAHESKRDVAVCASFPGMIISEERDALRRLSTGGWDWPEILLVETCVSLDEATTAARAARSLIPHLLILTAHFRLDGQMPDGTLPGQFVSAMLTEGIDIVGANCGDNPESFVDITRQMRAVTDAPLLIQPSAGLPQQDENCQWHYPIEPSTFANNAVQLFAAGANIVGGCCGTTPAHIAAVCAALQR